MADVYDGFISYSHAADDLLAPRLQSALQRFAKPWWKRRAVRIFRDESSLSANPHLWSSITEALDTSGWFVLLLSPDAAASEWVNQEIAYWVENRDPNKILPVLTDGTFDWADDDVSGDAVPGVLNGVFTEEPRWVDVRWANDEDQLDLKDPRFADAIADIASTIRGIPKDDLASEEVRQHRRTVRTAWAAGLALLALTVVAIGASIQSARNADEAERQAEIAAEQAELAEANAEEARTNAAAAEANAAAEAEAREEADQNARLARSRELSAAAISVLDENPELATRLVVQASSILGAAEQPAAVVDALWRASLANKLVDVIEVVDEPEETGYFTTFDLSADGKTLLVALGDFDGEGGRLVRYNLSTSSVAWEWEPGLEQAVEYPAISPDGRHVAFNLFDVASGVNAATVILDLETGEPVHDIRRDGCIDGGDPVWSPDGSVLAVATAFFDCSRDDIAAPRWVELLDASTWDTIRLDDLPQMQDGNEGSVSRWAETGELHVFGDHPTVRYDADLSAFEELEDLSGYGDVSRDGSLIAIWTGVGGDLAIYDAITLSRSDLLPVVGFPRPDAVRFTADGTALMVGTEGNTAFVFDVATGLPKIELPGGITDNMQQDPSSGRIYTSHPDGTIGVWDADSAAFGLEVLADLGAASWVNGNGFSPSDGYTAVWHIDIPRQSYTSFFDPATGLFIGDPIPTVGRADPLADGRFAVFENEQSIVAIDPDSEEMDQLWESDEEAPVDFYVSLAGDEIAVVDFDETGRLRPDWTILTLDGGLSSESHPSVPGMIGLTDTTIFYLDEFSSRLVAVDRASDGEVWRLDFDIRPFSARLTGLGVEVGFPGGFGIVELDSGEMRFVEGDLGRLRGWQVSPDGERVALGDEDKVLILDLQTGLEILRIPIGGGSDFHWFEDSTLLIGTNDGLWGRLTLDVEQLVADARSSLRSGFSEADCATYAIDPCPTLEELRGG